MMISLRSYETIQCSKEFILVWLLQKIGAIAVTSISYLAIIAPLNKMFCVTKFRLQYLLVTFLSAILFLDNLLIMLGICGNMAHWKEKWLLLPANGVGFIWRTLVERIAHVTNKYEIDLLKSKVKSQDTLKVMLISCLSEEIRTEDDLGGKWLAWKLRQTWLIAC